MKMGQQQKGCDRETYYYFNIFVAMRNVIRAIKINIIK